MAKLLWNNGLAVKVNAGGIYFKMIRETRTKRRHDHFKLLDFHPRSVFLTPVNLPISYVTLQYNRKKEAVPKNTEQPLFIRIPGGERCR